MYGKGYLLQSRRVELSQFLKIPSLLFEKKLFDYLVVTDTIQAEETFYRAYFRLDLS